MNKRKKKEMIRLALEEPERLLEGGEGEDDEDDMADTQFGGMDDGVW